MKVHGSLFGAPAVRLALALARRAGITRVIMGTPSWPNHAQIVKDLKLVAATTVNGNVEVQYCTDNTLRVLDHIGRSDIPVHEGAARPLVRPDFALYSALFAVALLMTSRFRWWDWPLCLVIALAEAMGIDLEKW